MSFGASEIYFFASFFLTCIPAISGQSAFVPIMVWAAAVCLIAYGANRNRRSAAADLREAQAYLRTLGLITYPLYLTHNVIGAEIIHALINAGLNATVAVWVALAMRVLVCWFICATIEPAVRGAMMKAISYFGLLPEKMPASRRTLFARCSKTVAGHAVFARRRLLSRGARALRLNHQGLHQNSTTGDAELAFQMPLYPMIDDRQNSVSVVGNDAPVWDAKANRVAWLRYLDGVTNVTPYAARARCTDYTKLPPTITYVGSTKPFRDETKTYVENLRRANVPVEFEIIRWRVSRVRHVGTERSNQ
jgi:phosphate/sulfate permease